MQSARAGSWGSLHTSECTLDQVLEDECTERGGAAQGEAERTECSEAQVCDRHGVLERIPGGSVSSDQSGGRSCTEHDSGPLRCVGSLKQRKWSTKRVEGRASSSKFCQVLCAFY